LPGWVSGMASPGTSQRRCRLVLGLKGSDHGSYPEQEINEPEPA
jgi:hypothetical protein